MWSPDSQQIGFTLGGELYVMQADGTRLTKITSTDDFYISVTAWAPTENKIAFDDRGNAVYIINADGTELIELPHGLWEPAWSPNSTHIAYGCQIEGQIETCIVKADGTELSTIPLETDSVSWSSSGEQLVFTSNWDESQGLYTINVDGSNLAQITSSETDDIMPLWQP